MEVFVAAVLMWGLSLSVVLAIVSCFLVELHDLWLNWCNYRFDHQLMRAYCERQRALREHPSAQ